MRYSLRKFFSLSLIVSLLFVLPGELFAVGERADEGSLFTSQYPDGYSVRWQTGVGQRSLYARPASSLKTRKEKYFDAILRVEKEEAFLLNGENLFQLMQLKESDALVNLETYVKNYIIRSNPSYCEAMLGNFLESRTLAFRNYKAVRVDFTWRENPYQSRTWELYYHSLHFLACLVDRYPDKVKEVGDLFFELATDWIEVNRVKSTSDRIPYMAWDDHTAAIRLSTMTYVIRQLLRNKYVFDRGDVEKVMKFAALSAELMNTEGFHYTHHNHGFMQSLSAMYFASSFPNFQRAPTWLERSIESAIDYFHYSYDSEGVHKENSSGYHLLMQRHLDSLIELLPLLEVQGDSVRELEEKLHLSKEYNLHLNAADGNLVPNGDTKYGSRSSLDREALSTVSPYKVFRTSGYASLGKRDAMVENDIQLFFTNALSSLTHKHADNLGFHLTAYGRAWLVDSGMSAYRRDAYRGHCKRSYAHNTILIDEKSHPLTPVSPSKTAVSGKLSKSFFELTGSHTLYENYRVKRKITYDLKSTYVFEDSVECVGECHTSRTFDLLFQAAPDLVVDTQGNTTSFKDPSSQQTLTVYRCPQEDRAIRIDSELVKGQTTPYLLGWVYPGLKPTPTTVLRVRGSGKSLLPIRHVMSFSEEGKTDTNDLNTLCKDM